MSTRPQLVAPAVPAGHWIAATRVLHRPVPADGPYPHVCGYMTDLGRIQGRDCPACIRTHPEASHAA